MTFFDGLSSFLGFLDYFLQIFAAVFKNQILSGFSIFTSAVKNFKHFNNIFAIAKAI
jgi:hypothetical protein